MGSDAPLDVEALGIRMGVDVASTSAWWMQPNIASTTLTYDDIRAAVEKLYEQHWVPCAHVVHPQAEGWTTCAMCFEPMFIIRDEEGRLHV